MPQLPMLTATLERSVPLSERTKHLEFRVEGVDTFDFAAGQFVSLKATRNGREVTRAYSIASSPRGSNRFDLCLNRVEDGFFSNYLCDLPEGAEVKLRGPYGHFVLRNPARSSLLIATGTGIAPMRGMLHWLFADQERHLGREFWLVFGARTQGDLYYHNEFTSLAQYWPNFHYLPTLSRPDESWTGAHGYVQQHVPNIAAGRGNIDAYICGLRRMVFSNCQLLEELGWDRKTIRFERYD